MAALLTCNGLALGQAPEIMISGQPPVEFGQPSVEYGQPSVEYGQPASRGLFGNRVMQAQATTVTPLPMPAAGAAPAGQPAPLVTTMVPTAGDFTTGPVTLDTRAAAWLDASQNTRSWINGEFILWRIGDAALPSLGVQLSGFVIPVATKDITTTVTGTSVTQDSVISLTQVPATITVDASLPDGNDIDFKDQPGFLIRAGHWFDAEQCLGVDINFFWMWRRSVDLNAINSVDLTVGSGVFPNLTNITAPPAESQSPGSITNAQGEEVQISVNLSSELHVAASNRVWGFDANLISRTVYFGPLTIDFLGGIRFMEIDQELIRNQLISLNPTGGQFDPNTGAAPVIGDTGTANIFPGGDPALQPLTGNATVGTVDADGNIIYASQSILLGDRIRATNRFYGVQLGTAFDWDIGYGLFMNGFGKVAIGDMHQTFRLQSTATGFLVNAFDNNTTRESDRICFMPEFNLNLGYAFSPGARIYAGWNIIHISSIASVNSPVLAASTTNTLTVNDNSASATATGFGFKFDNHKTNLQGLNVGAELRW